MISEDLSNIPQNLRFSDSISDIDVVSISHLHDGSDGFPIGTTSLSMGQIPTGKYLWIKPASTISIIISNGNPIQLAAGKATKLWANFTSIQIVVPNTTQNQVTPVQVTAIIGG